MTIAAPAPDMRPLRVLTVGGLDPTGGAGIAADLKTIAAHGAWGTAALTAVTVQDTRRLDAVEPVSPRLVDEQIATVLADIGADAIKIGMLANAGIVETVARRLKESAAGTPVVLDPVLAAGVGGALLEEAAVAELKARLLPLVTVVTPNAPELARLTGLEVAHEQDLARAARRLLEETGVRAVHAKAGHLATDPHRDLLVTADGTTRVFEAPHVRAPAHHGTGCTLASAFACALAARMPVEQAAAAAHAFVQRALRAGHRTLGRGAGPVDPCWRWRPDDDGDRSAIDGPC